MAGYDDGTVPDSGPDMVLGKLLEEYPSANRVKARDLCEMFGRFHPLLKLHDYHAAIAQARSREDAHRRVAAAAAVRASESLGLSAADLGDDERDELYNAVEAQQLEDGASLRAFVAALHVGAGYRRFREELLRTGLGGADEMLRTKLQGTGMGCVVLQKALLPEDRYRAVEPESRREVLWVADDVAEDVAGNRFTQLVVSHAAGCTLVVHQGGFELRGIAQTDERGEQLAVARRMLKDRTLLRRAVEDRQREVVGIMVDVSNLLHTAMNMQKTLLYKQLRETLSCGREVARSFAAGSYRYPNERETLHRNWKTEAAFDEVVLVERGQASGKEEYVDNMIIARIQDFELTDVEAICKRNMEPVLVLGTGDGNCNDNWASFSDAVEQILPTCKVEMWTWKKSRSGKYGKLAAKHPERLSIRYLDGYGERLYSDK